MAYLTNTDFNAAPTFGERFSAFVATQKAAAAQRRLYRQTVKELNALSSVELADLGLHRSNIQAIAYDSVYGA